MNVTRRRGRIMILLAWLAAGVFALPQTFVFRVLKHPEIDFYQCTSMGFFREVLGEGDGGGDNATSATNATSAASAASAANATNATSSSSRTILGLGPDDLERVYSSIFLVAVYMVPLLVIVVTYANILRKIVRKRRGSASEEALEGGEEGGGGGGGGGGGEEGRMRRRSRSKSSARRHLYQWRHR